MKHIIVKFKAGNEIHEPLEDDFDKIFNGIVIRVPRKIVSTHWTNRLIAEIGKIAGGDDSPALIDHVSIYDGPEQLAYIQAGYDEHIKLKPSLDKLIFTKANL